jgi:hypothetical protein
VPWFNFRQNNSGGSFYFDKAKGLTVEVLIEAEDAASANSIAEEKGIYFEGIDDGIDCSCCGDRWYRVSNGEPGEPVPSLYGQPLSEASLWTRWSDREKDQKEVAIHYLDGRIEWFNPPTKDEKKETLSPPKEKPKAKPKAKKRKARALDLVRALDLT